MIINISIADKRPAVDGAPVIVCNNKGSYTIQFTFDDEWNAYAKKVVRFVWIQKGKVKFKDVEMTGTTCTVPALSNTDKVRVGVFAGDICTTTPAVIPCVRSILCEGGTPSVENDKYYANEARAARDRAEAAAETAAVEATAAAEAEVTRLVGELGVVPTTGVSPTSVISQAGASRSFANALKGKERGGLVLCEDVSPLLHPVGVKVRSRNLLSNGDITFSWYTWFSVNLPAGSYSFGALITSDNTVDSRFLVLFVNAAGQNVGILELEPNIYNSGVVTLTAEATTIRLYAGKDYYTAEGHTATYANIMLAKSTTAEPYTPFVADGTAVRVRSGGANLFGGDAFANKVVEFGGYKNESAGTVYLAGGDAWDKIAYTNFKANTQYTFIIKASTQTLGGINLIIKYTDGTRYIPQSTATDTAYVWRVVSESGKTVESFSGEWQANTTYYYNECGIFEGVMEQSDFEPYKAGQSIDTTVGATLDLESIAPYMSVYTDTAGTAVDVEYVKDTNAVFQKLVNAIVALGGNV